MVTITLTANEMAFLKVVLDWSMVALYSINTEQSLDWVKRIRRMSEKINTSACDVEQAFKG